MKRETGRSIAGSREACKAGARLCSKVGFALAGGEVDGPLSGPVATAGLVGSDVSDGFVVVFRKTGTVENTVDWTVDCFGVLVTRTVDGALFRVFEVVSIFVGKYVELSLN
jgi:hypothetical protein